MKYLFILLSLSMIGLYTSCSDSEINLSDLCPEGGVAQIIIPALNDVSLEVPRCFSLVPLQGIDSSVGRIEAQSLGLEIRYDIGLLAGQSVRPDSPTQTTVQGDFEEFRYHIQDDRLIFTFPNAGPANFTTEQVNFEAVLVEMFKSLQVL